MQEKANCQNKEEQPKRLPWCGHCGEFMVETKRMVSVSKEIKSSKWTLKSGLYCAECDTFEQLNIEENEESNRRSH